MCLYNIINLEKKISAYKTPQELTSDFIIEINFICINIIFK